MSLPRFIKALSLMVILPPMWFSHAHSNEVNTISPLYPSDLDTGDHFSFSSTTDGKWLLIGSKYSSHGGSRIGAVYVYRYTPKADDWTLFQKILPDNGIEGGEFGESVAILGNRMIVGARFNTSSTGTTSGTAYVYKFRGYKIGWSLEQELEPPQGVDKEEFGRSVALSNKQIMVGSRFAQNSDKKSSGAVYIYEKRDCSKQWKFAEKLIDPSGDDNDQFGRSIVYSSMMGGVLAVASRQGSIKTIDKSGKVLIYKKEKSSWTLSQIVSAQDANKDDYFGQSISISQNKLIIGSRNAKNNEELKTGAVYIYQFDYQRNNWMHLQKISAPDGKDKDQFGFAIAIDRRRGTHLAISARRANSQAGKKTGKVYLYSFKKHTKNFTFDETISPESLQPDDEFGQSLAIDPRCGKWLIIGADQSSFTGNEKAGISYLVKMK
jgi:hypothetical protein